MATDGGAAQSGQQRAETFRQLALDHRQKAESYERLAAAVEKGNEGEREVARLLDVLDGAGWVVLHDRYRSRRSPANIDHLVVGPPGVFVIDAKNWSGGRLRTDGRGMAVGRYRRDSELASAVSTAEDVAVQVAEALPGAVTVPVLAFTAPVGLPGPTPHQGAVLLQAEHLLAWLTSAPARLTPQQVRRVGSTLDAALPPRSGSPVPLTVHPEQAARAPRPAAGGPAVRSRGPVSAPSGARGRARSSRLRQAGLRQVLLDLVFGAAMVVLLLLLLPRFIAGMVSTMTTMTTVTPVPPAAPASTSVSPHP